MNSISLAIFDETLRDGEQQAGIYFSSEQKDKLAHLIAAVGVHDIDLMPVIESTEAKLLSKLISDGLGSLMCPAVMLNRKYIDQARQTGVKKIILFGAVSDRLLFLRNSAIYKSDVLSSFSPNDVLPLTVVSELRETAASHILDCLQYAASGNHPLEIDFAAEDASRAHPEFLTRCMSDFSPYLRHFLLCDTVGCLTPEYTYRWVKELIAKVPGLNIGVHFHNDMGLALENTLQAVLAGASCVSGTFSGIGERAGNVALEQVLWGLKSRFGVVVEGINYPAITPVLELLETYHALPERPYSEQARRHESGIHVSSLLKDARSYSIFPYETPVIWFGKNSGASNFKYLFDSVLCLPQSDELYADLRDQLKKQAYALNQSFSETEVCLMLANGTLSVKNALKLKIREKLNTELQLSAVPPPPKQRDAETETPMINTSVTA